MKGEGDSCGDAVITHWDLLFPPIATRQLLHVGLAVYVPAPAVYDHLRQL